MGDPKMKEYESIINSQKEHINRYEQRLKDIVAAYKGLAKEKAALEASLQAMTVAEGGKREQQPKEEEAMAQMAPQAEDLLSAGGDGHEHQVHKLMASIATISAERNRLEEVFQRERKQLRAELASKTATVRELSEKLTARVAADSRHGEQALMIRELKKLLADERNLKENLELQLGELKTQFLLNLNDKLGVAGKGSAGGGGAAMNASESQQGKLETSGRLNATLTNSLQELQMEMGQLKKQHSVAVANEKQRARMAEERSKRLGEIHEDRVANLEARITELSTVIGRYDRMQQVDKENILQLKDTIARLQVSECLPPTVGVVAELPPAADDSGDEGGVTEDDDKDEIDHLKWRYEQCIGENQHLKEEIRSYKESIVKLKAKADHLNRNIEQLETELKERSIEHGSMLKREHAKHADAMGSLQAAYEGQIAQLEGKLQNQRERSLTVVEAKDEEIKTLRTSLEILSLSGQQQQHLQGERHYGTGSGLELKNSNDGTGGGHQHHLLHYAHEFARKDVEITSLRTAKNSIEETLRQALQQKVVLEQTYNQRCSQMQREIERLQLGNSHEGSNHEYLKNVFLSFLLTRDPDSRKHMANAIAAVLKFNDSEMQTLVNSELYK